MLSSALGLGDGQSARLFKMECTYCGQGQSEEVEYEALASHSHFTSAHKISVSEGGKMGEGRTPPAAIGALNV